METKTFRLEHWQNIFPFLRPKMWACKIDLKDAYFHLALSQELRPFVRMLVGTQVWEFQAAAFGLNILPRLWMQVMKPFQKIWRSRGILMFVYLDDILILGTSPKLLQSQVDSMLLDLEHAGMTVNRKKSILQPTQRLQHLGFVVDFVKGQLCVPKEKVKMVRKDLGKLVKLERISPRKMAAILGVVRSFLTVMPFLRAFTDQLCKFVNQARESSWDYPRPIPEDLKVQIREIKDTILEWTGRDFTRQPQKTLYSDSSGTGWAGLNPETGALVHDFWREKIDWHINLKELMAATNTVQSLAQPGQTICLRVDNSVTFHYLLKGGGRKTHINALLRPFLKWCLTNNVHLQLELVPSRDMLADGISRSEQDRGDYTLDRSVFGQVLEFYKRWKAPQVDAFASPGNAQLKDFISRWPHFQAVATDALTCDLSQFGEIYANPPWSVIPQWLNRLRDNPHLTCLAILPYWVSIFWWPQAVKLQATKVPCLLIPGRQGLFTNCFGESMAPTKWPLVCMLLSGKFYRHNKCRIQLWRLT